MLIDGGVDARRGDDRGFSRLPLALRISAQNIKKAGSAAKQVDLEAAVHDRTEVKGFASQYDNYRRVGSMEQDRMM